jgi:hypothetical protein
MIGRSVRNILFVVAIAAMIMPFSLQNASSAGKKAQPTEYNLYFGDLHTHTSYSDGAGTPWDAFAAANDAGADFMATTDHVHYPYGNLMLTPELWQDTLAAADAYTKDGTFVAMAGYELWLPWTGEINIYNTREIYDATGNHGGHGYNNGLQESIRTCLPSLYDWLAKTGAIGQWNHPTYWTGPLDKGFNESVVSAFFDFDYYTETRDLGMSMLENFENPDYEKCYVWALDAGWHVLPAANSDTHSANWISGSELRTVLLAPSLTSHDLYDAMKASRGYATQDKNLEIYYTLNGGVMGSELSPVGTYEVSVHISDPDGSEDAIRLVEVVSDGGAVVASMSFDSASVDWTTTLTSDSAHYYYLRVTTASNLYGEEGATAWTAPVWTGN